MGERRKPLADHKTAFLFVGKSLPSAALLLLRGVMGSQCSFLLVLQSVSSPKTLQTCERPVQWFSFFPSRCFSCLISIYSLPVLLFYLKLRLQVMLYKELEFSLGLITYHLCVCPEVDKIGAVP